MPELLSITTGILESGNHRADKLSWGYGRIISVTKRNVTKGAFNSHEFTCSLSRSVIFDTLTISRGAVPWKFFTLKERNKVWP